MTANMAPARARLIRMDAMTIILSILQCPGIETMEMSPSLIDGRLLTLSQYLETFDRLRTSFWKKLGDTCRRTRNVVAKMSANEYSAP